MAQKLPADVVRNRLREYVAKHYLMLTSVIKGVVLYAAAYSLLAIVKNSENVVPRLALWLALLAGALFSYATWARGMVMTTTLAMRFGRWQWGSWRFCYLPSWHPITQARSAKHLPMQRID